MRNGCFKTQIIAAFVVQNVLLGNWGSIALSDALQLESASFEANGNLFGNGWGAMNSIDAFQRDFVIFSLSTSRRTSTT